MNQELIAKPTLEDVLNTNMSRRSFLKAAGLASLAPLVESCATAFGVKPHESDNFNYYLPDDLSEAAVKYIKEEHELGLKKLEDFLHVRRDYGRSIGRKITITIVPSGASTSFLFGERAGTIQYNRGVIAAGTMGSTRAPFIHELTHHYVNKAGDFFSEGLAVYTQEQLGRNPSGPNYGADLHRKIADMELMPLSRIASVQSLGRGLPEDEVVTAYLQAGSFVKYLVEDISKKDTKPFMKFFIVDGDYKGNFGTSLEELEAGWREKI